MIERERFKAVLHFEKVDRVPNVEIGYWTETFARWRKEGLPAGIPLYPEEGDRRYSRHSRQLTEYFNLDAHNYTYGIGVSDELSPAPVSEIVGQDDDTVTVRYSSGYEMKYLKSNPGIFHEIDWPVKSTKDWRKICDHCHPGWHNISAGTPESLPPENRDYAASLTLPGFFWQMRRWMGFEKACTVFYEEPGFAEDMLDFWADYLLEQCKLILGHFIPEFIYFDEDMAYNHGPMLSPAILKKFFAPRYSKVAGYLNSKGVDIVGVDSDGFPDEMIPVLYDAGINLWCPFEIICREGRDDLQTLGKKYPWLRMLGGIDKTALSKGYEAIDEEVSKIAPLVKRGGFIPTIDHKVPPEVSLDAYRYYLRKKAERLNVT